MGSVPQSSISEFLLLALADTRQLQLLHFWLLLGIYLAALLGNGLISTAVACDHRLHTPMYFFLLNLALLDLGCISTTLPKAMANLLGDTRDISYPGCAAQVFFSLLFISAEYSLLAVMSYDRYIAICKPLHYGTMLVWWGHFSSVMGFTTVTVTYTWVFKAEFDTEDPKYCMDVCVY
ncbi:olfactory receptor 1F12-like [Gallus gallus]|uniref:olfactory receptor 1F12-like n=1 Tax=Gallus gallus TaxID=9031 RepID=UPI001AEB65BE|nr:olfactory receptor 1F12-like [Gallus gallus]